MPEMGIIKIEINLAELGKAVDTFKRNRLQALEHLSQDIKTAVSQAIHQLLHAEITAFLGQAEQHENKRNGYHKERTYTLKHIGSLRIRVPRDRNGAYLSQIIPPQERMDPRLKEDMGVLHLAGISTRTLSMISKRILGIAVSTQTVTNALHRIEPGALRWLYRRLDTEYWALFIDGTNFNLQRAGTTEREPALVVLGLDGQNRLSILAIEPGQKDNADCWRMIFRGLKERGLKTEAVTLGIMDGLPGLETAFEEAFVQAKAARCWVHAMNNIMAKVPKRFRETFKSLADGVGYAESEAQAREAFTHLKAVMGQDASRAVQCLAKDLEALLVHYRYDRKLWRSLRSTNPIERVNKELKRRTKSMESMGEKTLMIVAAFTALRLELNWQKMPVDAPQLQNLMYIKQRQLNDIDLTMNTLIH